MEHSPTITLTKVLDFYNTHGLGGVGNYGTQSNQYFNQGMLISIISMDQGEQGTKKHNPTITLKGEKEEDIYEDLCSFNSSDRQLQQEMLNIQPVEKRDYILKVGIIS